MERAIEQLIKLEHYCFLRWHRAQLSKNYKREYELFWINKGASIGETLDRLRKETNVDSK